MVYFLSYDGYIPYTLNCDGFVLSVTFDLAIEEAVSLLLPIDLQSFKLVTAITTMPFMREHK